MEIITDVVSYILENNTVFFNGTDYYSKVQHRGTVYAKSLIEQKLPNDRENLW